MGFGIQRIKDQKGRSPFASLITLCRFTTKTHFCDGRIDQDPFRDDRMRLLYGQVHLVGQAFLFITLLHDILFIHIQQMQHDPGKLWIKLCLDPLDQFLAHHLLGNRLTITALAGHGIISICHRYDPGDLRDIIPLQPLRIASSVIAFVMIIGPHTQIGRLADA